MTRQATTAEVRKSYKNKGLLVKISRDGYVSYKSDQERFWIDGGCVEEYGYDDEFGGAVHHGGAFARMMERSA